AASAVVLFEPQPLEYLRPEQAPARLMRLGEKLAGLRRLGIHRVGLARFDAQFAALTPLQFVQTVLLDKLACRSVWVGDDFRFGLQRQGDFATLQYLGAELGFRVAQTPTYELNGRRLASTWLREALSQADLVQAAEILGQRYQVTARVLHGQKLGRTIGFPTLNLLFKYVPALTGVFIVQVHGLSAHPLWGVANVGKRPTVDGQQHRLEVHVLDWQGDAYGKSLSVEFYQQIRKEQKFASVNQLMQQIQRDVVNARAWIERHHQFN
ncbi:MAG: bifunctional riboflavin kinase/FAD synthetase, partial [Thiotrichales bacterium]